MATINDFSDILSAMEQNPELQEAMRNHVLGQELRQLPAVVQHHGELLVQIQDRLTELASTLRDTTEQIASYALVSSRVITTTVERLDRVESDLAELRAAQARLEASVQEIREVQARMENDVAELKTDVAELKTDVVELKTDVVELKTEQATTNRRLNRIEGQLGNLNGRQMEYDVHSRIPGIVFRHLMLERTHILKARGMPQANELENILLDARDAGRITREDILEVMEADVIVTAQDRERETYVITGEISRTLDNSDITRAAERARIMSAATGHPAIALAIAQNVAAPQEEFARSQGVTVIRIEADGATRHRPQNRPSEE